MMEKDYSLLRPFDLEAAKRGEELVLNNGDSTLKYVGEPTPKIQNFFPHSSLMCLWVEGPYQNKVGIYAVSELRMKPLCWVEGRPVYEGDVLYSSFFHGMEECKDGIFEVTGVDGDGQFLAGKLSKKHATQFESCSWNPPKVKHEVKLLAYLDADQLFWLRETALPKWPAVRVPSEDKTVEVEE